MAKTRDKADLAPGQQPEAPLVDVQNDEHRGIGGSYRFDPITGKRERVAGPVLDNQIATEQLGTEALDNEIQ